MNYVKKTFNYYFRKNNDKEYLEIQKSMID